MKVIPTIATASIALGVAMASTENTKRELILGGNEIPIGSKTYVTSIRSTADGDTFCGGVLITPTHVLTTASCTTFGAMNYAVVGTHYNNGSTDGDAIEIVSAQNHSQFNFDTSAYDFAVLTLATASSYSPVNLPSSNGSEVVTGVLANAMGWGWTSYPNGTNSYDLLGVGLQIWDNNDCGIVFANYSAVDDTMVCAGGIGNKDVCSYDNGGPLILENGSEDADDVVVGLTSWGLGCGYQGVPSVFSRVSVVVDWINAVTQSSSSQYGTTQSSSSPYATTQSSSSQSSSSPYVTTQSSSSPAAIIQSVAQSSSSVAAAIQSATTQLATTTQSASS